MGKGLGLFLLRDFERGEKILVERAVSIQTNPGKNQIIDFGEVLWNKNMMAAAMALSPLESTILNDKFRVNNHGFMGTECEMAGLFLNFSRVNHECIGNVTH